MRGRIQKHVYSSCPQAWHHGTQTSAKTALLVPRSLTMPDENAIAQRVHRNTEVVGSERYGYVETCRAPKKTVKHPQNVVLTSRQCVSQRHRATAEPRIGGLAEGPTVTPRSLALEPL